jgi:hypothetical protein
VLGTITVHHHPRTTEGIGSTGRSEPHCVIAGMGVMERGSDHIRADGHWSDVRRSLQTWIVPSYSDPGISGPYYDAISPEFSGALTVSPRHKRPSLASTVEMNFYPVTVGAAIGQVALTFCVGDERDMAYPTDVWPFDNHGALSQFRWMAFHAITE